MRKVCNSSVEKSGWEKPKRVRTTNKNKRRKMIFVRLDMGPFIKRLGPPPLINAFRPAFTEDPVVLLVDGLLDGRPFDVNRSVLLLRHRITQLEEQPQDQEGLSQGRSPLPFLVA